MNRNNQDYQGEHQDYLGEPGWLVLPGSNQTLRVNQNQRELEITRITSVNQSDCDCLEVTRKAESELLG